MKRLIAFLTALFLITLTGNSQQALIIIDIQDFYFPGGRSELVQPEVAGGKAAALLAGFRNQGKTVVHVRHNFEPGGAIHSSVAPLSGEKIVSKDNVNAFQNTDLLEYLRSQKVDTLVICGMQTHMCVEAAVRAGADYGFKCIVVHDACTTRDLKFGEKTVGWQEVHYATLATLKSYGQVMGLEEYLKLK